MREQKFTWCIVTVTEILLKRGFALLTAMVCSLLLRQNTLTKSSLRRKGLIWLTHRITACHRGKSGLELKQEPLTGLPPPAMACSAALLKTQDLTQEPLRTPTGRFNGGSSSAESPSSQVSLVCVKLTKTNLYTPLDLSSCQGGYGGAPRCEDVPSSEGRGTQRLLASISY